MDPGARHIQAGKTVDTGGKVPRTKAEKVVASLLGDLYPGYTRVMCRSHHYPTPLCHGLTMPRASSYCPPCCLHFYRKGMAMPALPINRANKETFSPVPRGRENT